MAYFALLFVVLIFILALASVILTTVSPVMGSESDRTIMLGVGIGSGALACLFTLIMLFISIFV